MRVRLNKEQPTAKQKRTLKEQCKKEFFYLLEDYNKQVALQIMYVLHFHFGYGNKRLMQFFKLLKQMQAKHIDQYEVNDADIPDICEIKLREAGIDVNEFFEFENKE